MTITPERLPGPAPSPGTARRASRPLGNPTQCRVLFAGPVGVGKTTAVRAVSDIETVETEAPLTADVEHGVLGAKTTTTVGIDYGVWRPRPDVSVSLIGTPGQERFATSRATMMSPWTRVILWLHGASPDVQDDAAAWLRAIGAEAHGRVVIAMTRTDEDAASVRRRLDPVLGHASAQIPVLAADPRDAASVKDVICAALDLPEEVAP